MEPSAMSRSSPFAPELIEAYPDALVVLVERDIKTWYKSFKAAIIEKPISTPSYRSSATWMSDFYINLAGRWALF
jgi:hypothetical protein